MVSFDVTSLFTNVPLEFTIDIILRKVNDEKLVDIKIPQKELKELLFYFVQKVCIFCLMEIFTSSLGSPLGPVIAGIFMVELKKTRWYQPFLINCYFGGGTSMIPCAL